jgi:hypothetical protein
MNYEFFLVGFFELSGIVLNLISIVVLFLSCYYNNINLAFT